VLDVHFALLRGENILVPFGVDEASQAVALGETVGYSLAMLPERFVVVPT